jgi:hypothetical protein
MSYGIRISKSGYNALTESDVNNYIFHSDYNTFKIVKTGNGSFTVTGSSTEDKTITHNYGTRVGFIVFFEHPNSRITYMNSLVDDGSSTSPLIVRGIPPISNSTNSITFRVSNSNANNRTLKYNYYLFEMPI